jgi:ABC-2 type transport system permease protein
VTSLLFALRRGRWGIVGFSLAALVLNFVQALGFYQIAGHTPGERAAFGASMTTLAAQFVALFPAPIRPDTVGGYVQFRGFAPLAILFSAWALASATGSARGDEERGVVEAELAAGVPRPALVASRLAAFAIAIIVAAAAAGAGFVFAVARGGDTVGARGVVEACMLLVAVGLSSYGLCLLAAQLVTDRAAAAVGGALLLALFLANSLSRVFPQLVTWRWLSPFHYYELSQPLPPGGTFDARGLVVPLGVAIIATALAALAFSGRDLGAALFPLPVVPHRPSNSASRVPFWTVAVLRGIYERRAGLLGWCILMAVIAAVFVALTRTIVQVLLSVPALLPYLSIFVHQQLYPAVLGYTWFDVALLLFAALAITYVARWAAEDGDGRLEALLSAPESRAALVVERTAVLAAVALAIAAVSGIVLFYASHLAGIDLNPQHLAAACVVLIPFVLVFAGAGSLLTAWNPRAAVALLGAFAFASYLDDELATIYRLPGWLQSLSAFKLAGTPLLDGVEGRNLAILLLLAAVGLGSSILLMERRDVGA